jgi:hypothetical protein
MKIGFFKGMGNRTLYHISNGKGNPLCNVSAEETYTEYEYEGGIITLTIKRTFCKKCIKINGGMPT